MIGEVTYKTTAVGRKNKGMPPSKWTDTNKQHTLCTVLTKNVLQTGRTSSLRTETDTSPSPTKHAPLRPHPALRTTHNSGGSYSPFELPQNREPEIFLHLKSVEDTLQQRPLRHLRRSSRNGPTITPRPMSVRPRACDRLAVPPLPPECPPVGKLSPVPCRRPRRCRCRGSGAHPLLSPDMCDT